MKKWILCTFDCLKSYGLARNIIFDTKWGFGAYFLLFLPTFKANNDFFYFWACDIDFQKYDLTLS